jgi:hypothetical protein
VWLAGIAGIPSDQRACGDQQDGDEGRSTLILHIRSLSSSHPILELKWLAATKPEPRVDESLDLNMGCGGCRWSH